MGSNKLTGEVPPSICALSNLEILDLQNNNFFGELSFDLSNWPQLHYVNLERNNFSGSIPNGMQKEVQVINLGSNQFTGNIPPHICNLTLLMVLDLSNNKLSGSIPQCLNEITSMVQDELTFSFYLLPYTIELGIKGQQLEYTKYVLLRHIDLSVNNLGGEIPEALFRLSQLHSLNLSHNHIKGKIPEQIGGMENLESLDLSYNKLSGEIPGSMSNLSFLASLNLSWNNLRGEIPLGTQLQSFEIWSFVGNPGLCGAPLPKKCRKEEEEEDDHPNSAGEGNDDDDSFLKSLYVGMGVGFVVGFWGVSGSLLFVRAWRHKFFRTFDGVVDHVYVAVALKFKRFR